MTGILQTEPFHRSWYGIQPKALVRSKNTIWRSQLSSFADWIWRQVMLVRTEPLKTPDIPGFCSGVSISSLQVTGLSPPQQKAKIFACSTSKQISVICAACTYFHSWNALQLYTLVQEWTFVFALSGWVFLPQHGWFQQSCEPIGVLPYDRKLKGLNVHTYAAAASCPARRIHWVFYYETPPQRGEIPHLPPCVGVKSSSLPAPVGMCCIH